MTRRTSRLGAAALVALLAACGGGGGGYSGSDPGTPTNGTMKLSITDAPACGYDNAWVTVQKVRVHQSSSAGDNDAGWSEVNLAPALRIDLLTLTNGTLAPLGQVELPAGTYTQMRLVLADNATTPGANAVKPTGGTETELTTPSGQQSGLKMNVNLVVPAGQVADFAIDFDGCKSFVKAGNSGKILLKPVLTVVPILSPAGQKVQGWVTPAMAAAGTTVSVQVGGRIQRSTPPDVDGKFVLYPVPAGTYDLVVTAKGRVNAVVTGVPVTATASTVVNAQPTPIDTPVSETRTVGGTVKVNGGTLDTGGFVRALQTPTGGPTIEVGHDNARSDTGVYAIELPIGAPLKGAYVAGVTKVEFGADPLKAAWYQLSATVAATPTVLTTPEFKIDPPVGPQDFAFTAP